MKILKAAPGLDQTNELARMLGLGYEVIEYNPGLGLDEQGRDAEVFLLRDVPVTAAVMDACPKLKLLQRVGHHIVGVDFAHAKRKGIHVANIPAKISYGDRMVAEHALFLLLAIAKRVKDCEAHLSNRILSKVTTHALTGKTLGLIGVGNTGTELTKMVAGLGMRVMVVKRTIDRRLEHELGLAFMGDMSSLPKVLQEADFVSIHLPLDPMTVGFFGTRQFAMMKPGAMLINIARAPIVDKAALYHALSEGKLAGAGLDVFWEEPADPADPLLALPNVVLTPHVAGVTHEVKMNIARATAENIRLVAAGKAPNNAVSAEEH
jgi:phosphoglycerate dehydrogenase-like enzyme